MHLMSINNLSDFIQVIYSKRTNYAINEYFTKHIQFTTIYLLLRQKSNPKKYSEQKINMEKFVQSTEHDVHMYAKFGGLTFMNICN
jgi:hypothetical protein